MPSLTTLHRGWFASNLAQGAGRKKIAMKKLKFKETFPSFGIDSDGHITAEGYEIIKEEE